MVFIKSGNRYYSNFLRKRVIISKNYLNKVIFIFNVESKAALKMRSFIQKNEVDVCTRQLGQAV